MNSNGFLANSPPGKLLGYWQEFFYSAARLIAT